MLSEGSEPPWAVREVDLHLRTHQRDQRVLGMGFRDHEFLRPGPTE